MMNGSKFCMFILAVSGFGVSGFGTFNAKVVVVGR